jgi:hypothetical protein
LAIPGFVLELPAELAAVPQFPLSQSQEPLQTAVRQRENPKGEAQAWAGPQSAFR